MGEFVNEHKPFLKILDEIGIVADHAGGTVGQHNVEGRITIVTDAHYRVRLTDDHQFLTYPPEVFAGIIKSVSDKFGYRLFD